MAQAELPAPRGPRPPAIFTIHIGSKTLIVMLAALAILVALIVVDVADRLDGSEMRKAAAAGQDSAAGGPLPAMASAADPRRSPDEKHKPVQGDDDSVGEWHPQADRAAQSEDAQADWGAEPQPVRVHDSDGARAAVADNPNAGPPPPEDAAPDEEEALPVPAASPDSPSDAPPEQPSAGDRDRPPSRSITGDSDSSEPDHASVTLNGAGATFPNPLYQKWFSEFHSAHPQVKINYQSIGSGGGIAQLQKGAIDFGATDGPMTDEQLRETPKLIVHIPTVLDAVVPIYNVPGAGEIRFTPEVLAGIFLGRITTWNDPALQQANPGVRLPELRIMVVHRSDASAVTYTFTDFLSKISDDWKNLAAKGAAVSWPCGTGAQGNEGVRAGVRQLEGAIGYVQLIYALSNHMQYGSVRNASGQFVKASLDSVAAAAASVRMPDDFRASITNAPGKNAYPISSFTWLLVPQSGKGIKQRDLKAFLMWMIDEGEKSAPELTYAPLPKNVAMQVKQRIARLQ